MLTGLQIRAARALLRITSTELATLSRVGSATIRRAELEDGEVSMTAANAHAVRTALEVAGIVLLDPVEQVHDGGVALKPGAKPRKALSENGADVTSSDAGLDMRDPDMAAYWIEHPEQWLAISNTGRRVLSAEMFGDAFAADEAFGV